MPNDRTLNGFGLKALGGSMDRISTAGYGKGVGFLGIIPFEGGCG
jgi:hypothetical protein